MFSLKQQFGTDHNGAEVKLQQFQVFFDGVLVGYLPHGKQSQIQALFNFPHDQLSDDAVSMIAFEAAEMQGVDSVSVERPEQHSRQFVEAVRKALEEEGNDDE